MSIEDLAAEVGAAWRYQREGDPKTAIREFERILRRDPDNIDGLYGLGLSQRAAGQIEAAMQSFQRALDVVILRDTAGLAAREAAASNFETARIKPNTAEDDRYMMLRRMLSQRIDETKQASSS